MLLKKSRYKKNHFQIEFVDICFFLYYVTGEILLETLEAFDSCRVNERRTLIIKYVPQ
jgi:hypothetical protein